MEMNFCLVKKGVFKLGDFLHFWNSDKRILVFEGWIEFFSGTFLISVFCHSTLYCRRENQLSIRDNGMKILKQRILSFLSLTNEMEQLKNKNSVKMKSLYLRKKFLTCDKRFYSMMILKTWKCSLSLSTVLRSQMNNLSRMQIFFFHFFYFNNIFNHKWVISVCAIQLLFVFF